MKRYLSILLAILMACPSWAVERNVTGQKFTVVAIDSVTGRPKTGDAANITVYVSKDDGAVTVLADTSATEDESTNAKGCYTFDAAQAETNAIKLKVTGKSTTSGIDIVPQTLYTTPANWSLASIDGSGRVNVGKHLDQAVTLDTNNVLNVSSKYTGGTLNTAGDPIKEILLRKTGKAYYVAASGGSAGGPGTYALPFNTYANAEAAASYGDTIWLKAGAYTSTIIQTKPGIAIQGEGVATTTITADVPTQTGVVVLLSHGSIRDVTITNTATAGEAAGGNLGLLGGGIYSTSASYVMVERCVVTGTIDGWYSNAGTNYVVRDSTFTSGWDGANIPTAAGLFERVNFISDGSIIVAGQAARGLTVISSGGGAPATFRDCIFTTSRSTATASGEHAIGADIGQGTITDHKFINCKFKGTQADSGALGQAIALYSHGAAQNVASVSTSEFFTTNLNPSGTSYHILATQGLLNVARDCVLDRSKVSGTKFIKFADDDRLISTAIATLANQTSFTLTIGSANDSAYLNSACVITSQTTPTQKAVVPISAYTGSTKTVTLASAPAFTIAVGDLVQIGPAGNADVIAANGTYGNAALNTKLGTPAGASVSADIATRLATSAYTAPPTAVANAAATLAATNGAATVAVQLQRLDASVSSAGGGSAGGPIEQRKVAPARLLLLKSRTDGTWGVNGRVRMSPNDTLLWGIECTPQLAAGANTFGVSPLVIGGADAAKLTNVARGVGETKAKFELHLDATATAANAITLVVPVQLSATETINVNVGVSVGP